MDQNNDAVQKARENTLFYETKCRRCGSLTEWFGGYKENLHGFMISMSKRTNDASQMPCKQCKKETVQDLVSYTSK
jgi:hypothetical protein